MPRAPAERLPSCPCVVWDSAGSQRAKSARGLFWVLPPVLCIRVAVLMPTAPSQSLSKSGGVNPTTFLFRPSKCSGCCRSCVTSPPRRRQTWNGTGLEGEEGERTDLSAGGAHRVFPRSQSAGCTHHDIYILTDPLRRVRDRVTFKPALIKQRKPGALTPSEGCSRSGLFENQTTPGTGHTGTVKMVSCAERKGAQRGPQHPSDPPHGPSLLPHPRGRPVLRLSSVSPPSLASCCSSLSLKPPTTTPAVMRRKTMVCTGCWGREDTGGGGTGSWGPRGSVGEERARSAGQGPEDSPQCGVGASWPRLSTDCPRGHQAPEI